MLLLEGPLLILAQHLQLDLMNFVFVLILNKLFQQILFLTGECKSLLVYWHVTFLFNSV